MEDSRTKDLIGYLKNYSNSLSSLEQFSPKDRVEYDSKTGIFSKAGAFAYLKSSITNWSFKEEDSERAIKAIQDFQGKLKETVEVVKRIVMDSELKPTELD